MHRKGSGWGGEGRASWRGRPTSVREGSVKCGVLRVPRLTSGGDRELCLPAHFLGRCVASGQGAVRKLEAGQRGSAVTGGDCDQPNVPQWGW